MSQKRTQFAFFPNEIVYYIFEFLTEFDILHAFAGLNRRYDDLIKFHIKQLDLNDGWQRVHHQLEGICEYVQKLKIDQYHLTYLSNYQFVRLHSLSLIDIIEW